MDINFLHKLNPLREKTVGLALGGGAMLACAHIGILKVLEKNKIKISAIAGTSAGSIIAGLYAFGIKPDKLEQIALNLKPSDIFSLRLSKMGLSTTNKIKQLIKKYIGDVKIEQSLIPLYIPATDLLQSKPVLMQNIPVCDAVAASCAIPGIFAPVEINNNFFIDGSLFADVPCKILKLEKIDIVIGVELVDRKQTTKKPANLFDVILKSFQSLMEQTRKERLQFADLIISPNVDGIGNFEFKKTQLIINRGEQAMTEQISNIRYNCAFSCPFFL